jgi:hypothetical protein
MKRIALLLVVLVVGAVMVTAQESPTKVPTVPCTITAPTEDEAAPTFAITFTSLKQSLTLPAEKDTVATVLNCSSSSADVALINTSPSAQLNAPIPVDENPMGLAESQNGYAIVNIEFANLRSGDGPQYTRVGVVAGGDRLIVLGHNEKFTWWYIQAGELRGWIFGELIVLRGDLTGTPIVTSVGEVTPATFLVGVSNPLYNALGSSGTVICSVQGNREYVIVGQSFNGLWINIEATCVDGTTATGWINAETGFVRNPANIRVPILQG